MIISASYRTDLPGFYSAWFERRYQAGFCLVANPFDQSLRRVPLTAPEVDGFLFWTRNIAPFVPVLQRLRLDEVPFAVHYTITGYPRELEHRVPASQRAVGLCHELAERFGPDVVVWRYDPVLLTDLTPADWHRRHFESLCRQLAGAANEVVVSFAQMYRKTTLNLRRSGREHGFGYQDPDDEAKRALLTELAAIAAPHGLRLTVCSQRQLLGPGLDDAACVDPGRLSRVAGRPIVAARKPHRTACGCS
ncbi:MAG: DUF1848 domain-containing protein, partial [Armatimonadetes bacterium]|nr:DUF1848 domain-containing protein [Armatimonadota bacterium]